MSSALRPAVLVTACALLIAALLWWSLDDSWSKGAQNFAITAMALLMVVPFVITDGEAKRHRIKLAALIALAFAIAVNLPFAVVNDRDPNRVTDPRLLLATVTAVFVAPTVALLALALITPGLTRLLSRLSTVAVAALLAWFGWSEWSARSAPPPASHRPVQKDPWIIEQKDALPRYVLKPDHTWLNTFGSNPRGTFDANNQIAHTTNADGYRGPLLSVEKPPDAFRMLVLGDSTAYGWGVGDDHLITSLLEDRLADQLGERRFEGLVLACPGYTTRDEVAILESKGLAYAPDMVVVWFAINDVAEQWDPLADKEAREQYAQAKPWYRRASVYVDKTLVRIQQKIVSRRFNRDIGNYYLDDHPNWQTAKADILRIRELSEAQGARVILALEPPMFPLGRKTYPYRRAHEIIRAFCSESGIPCYDLWEAVVDMDCTQLMVHAPPPRDPHPNERARELFADYLAEQLIKDQMLD